MNFILFNTGIKLIKFEMSFCLFIKAVIRALLIDNSHYRLISKLGKEMQINHHSKKEHTKISKIAKFGCEML